MDDEIYDIVQEMVLLDDELEGAGETGITPLFIHERRRRTQNLVASMEKLLTQGHPFAAFDHGPPQRSHEDARLSPQAPTIFAARRSLQHWCTLCSGIDSLQVPLDSVVFQILSGYVPVVLDWIDLLHPMNKNLQADLTTGGDHYMVCTDIIMLWDGILKLLSAPSARLDFLDSNRTVPYVVDIWVNLFRYVKADHDLTAALETVDRVLHVLEVVLEVLSQSTVKRVPDVVANAVAQSTRHSPRRLCRVVAQQAKVIRRSEDMIEARTLFSFGTALMTARSELRPTSCPREAVRSIVGTLDNYISLEWWDASYVLCQYLDALFCMTQDHRALEWAINADLFIVFARLLTKIPRTLPPLIDHALFGLGRAIYNGFSSWRVLHAFDKKNRDMLPRTRLAEAHPVLGAVITAYDARQGFLAPVRHLWKTMQRCGYKSCSKRDGLQRSEVRPCSCRLLSYCSITCQRRDWKEEHWQRCTSSSGWSTERDVFFVKYISLMYANKNKESVVAQARRIDPLRQHDLIIEVVHIEPTLSLNVRILEPVGVGATRSASLLAVWAEGKGTTARQFEINLNMLEASVDRESAGSVNKQ